VSLMSLRTSLFFFLTSVVLSTVLAVSQEPAHDQKRPKIGLVLEGGGALGLAHIGVLQWLEEHRIPISYVAGTSMGGLVGGFYATGNSPAQIRDLTHEIDWNAVLQGQIPFRDLSFRRKEDAVEYPNSLEFGLKKGVQFPEGFNSGFQVGLLLDRISLPYSEMQSFDDLPTPFACVATDLVSAKRHVFRDGSLAQALRSTMSLPGIFSPVRTDTAIYVDGGLLDNLPVDVAKEMGADLVIAIQLQNRDLKPTEALSSVGVLGQAISVVVAANELRSMESADILISVPLTDYTAMDYSKEKALIQKGYDAAASKAAVLTAFSVDEATWQQHLAQRQARRRTAPTPQFVQVTGTNPKLAQEMQQGLSDNVGKPVDPETMDRQLTYLAGDGRFTRLGYQMVEKDDQQGLLIRAEDKPYAPPVVLPLVYIDGGQYNNVQFTLGARVTFFDIGGFGSEWRNDISIGSTYLLRSEFYRPFGHNLHWFVAPQGFASDSSAYYYQGNTLVSDYRNRNVGGAFDVGYRFDRMSELRVGYSIGDQKYTPTVGTPKLGTVEGRFGVTSLQYNFLGRDNATVPRSGLDLHFRSQWYDANPGAPSGFPVTELQSTLFKPVSKPASVFFGANGGTSYTYHETGVPPFSLGGNQNLVAYGVNEFLVNQYFLLKVGYIRQLLSLPPILGGNLYFVGAYEAGKVYGLPNTISSLPTDGYAGVIVNTIFGPVLVGGAYGATGNHKFFFRLGRVF
jgi:NTE family protein